MTQTFRNMEISFYRRASKTDGWCTIYVRITIDGVRVPIESTGIRVEWDDWDPDKERVRASHPLASSYNVRVGQVKIQLENIWNGYIAKGVRASAEKVKQDYLQSKGVHAGVRLLDVFDRTVKERASARKAAVERGQKVPKGCSDSTTKNFSSTKAKLFDFLRERKNMGLMAVDVDADTYEDFVAWLRLQGHAAGTVRNRASVLKQVMAWAKRKKLISLNGIVDCALPADSLPDPMPISQEGFERLASHKFANPNMQKYADLFVVYCRTGMHYADLQSVINAAKEGKWHTIIDKDGVEWILDSRNKTEVTAKIPVLPEVRVVVEKYGGWGNLPTVSNQKLNQWLKLIAAELDLPAELSVGCGRDTMTDWLYNHQPASDETIKVILGRKSLRDIERYGKPDERRVKNDLAHLLK